MSISRWTLKHPQPEREQHLQKQFGITGLAAAVLAARGYSDEQLEQLFGNRPLQDPFALPDMDKAAARIRRALEEQEKVAVYGDYDCDGVCAATLLTTYLQSVGGNAVAYIPEREEGYGLSKQGIDNLKEQGVSLIITVDNGIAAVEEAAYAYAAGIQLVITDHHLVGDTLPRAEAVVDPHRPDSQAAFSDLCGAGVAFKLVAALEEGDYDTVFDFAGDLAAIATIGDMMPLVGENRVIVSRGLRMLGFTEGLGLRALMERAGIGKSPSAGSVAFGLCPRINAAGRFGKAKEAFALLTSEDSEQAEQLATAVCAYNLDRQQLEQNILQEIDQQLAEHPALQYDRILVLAGEGWPAGVVGLVAGKVCERAGKPAVVLSIDGDTAVGSARSLPGLSIYQAMKSCEQLLQKWGGHEQAGGMTLAAKDIDALRKALNEYAAGQKKPHPEQAADLAILPEQMSLEEVRTLSALAPFGQGNPQPLFMLQNARLEEIRPLSGGKHLRLKFIADNHMVSAVYFGMEQTRFYYKTGNLFHLLLRLELSRYQGAERVDVRIVDMRPAVLKQNKFINAADEFDTLMRGDAIPAPLRALIRPSKSEFIAVYKLLRQMKHFAGEPQDLYMLICKSSISFCKLRIILEVLRQTGLIAFSPDGIDVAPEPPHVDLMQAELMRRLSR